jgi:hypothetical protein
MVTKAGVGLVLERDPFLMLGQLHLSTKLLARSWQGILNQYIF